MVATGGSVRYTIELLTSKHVDSINVVSIITAPEALEILDNYTSNIIYITAAIDRELNENGYIIPGLGDAGDRIFNTF